MALPSGWSTVTVTWTLGRYPSGDAARGVVVFTSAQSVRLGGDTWVPSPIVARVTDGVMAPVALPTTDDPDINPTGWTWKVTALVNPPSGVAPFDILAPAAGGPINLATVVPVSSPSAPDAVAVGDQFLATQFADQSSRIRAALDDLYGVKAAALPIWAYGNSYANNGATGTGPTPTWFTPGRHYLNQAAQELSAGAVTSYGVNGTRLINVLDGVRDGAAGTSGTGVTPITGSLWPGVSARQGLVVLDSFFNDIAHYPTHVGTPAPALITTANTRYKDGVTGMLRAFLAFVSSQSRIDQTAATFAGNWINTAQAGTGISGGSTASTGTNGASATFTVTPPQYGPLAGKVFAIVQKISPELLPGGMAPINISVDGGTATTYAPTAWEQYNGTASGGPIQSCPDAIAISVPTDGAAHTIALSHNGAANQRLIPDCIVVPSEEPNPIAVMGCERPPNAVFFNATQTGIWKANSALLLPAFRSVVAEFPHAFYVPSTVTSSGLYSGDGNHPNDRGMAQRASDLTIACRSNIRARLRARVLDAVTTYAKV